MIRLLNADQMRELDRRTIEDYGVPGRVLMEHAGVAVARAADDLVRRPPGRVAIVCGKGNNGGDGFVAARWLSRWGHTVELWLAGAVDELKGDARANAELWQRLGGAIRDDLDALPQALAGADVIVDALLGTGVSGPPRPPLDGIVRAVNAAGAPVVAVDIPTGVDGDSGAAHDPHIAATRTLTFAALKRGLVMYPGAGAAGDVEVVDIGIPDALLDGLDAVPRLAERDDIRAMIPWRPADAHKGTAGKVLIVAGSRDFAGAAAICGRAAARGGSGLITLGVPESVATVTLSTTPETMSRRLPEDDEGRVATGAYDRLASFVEGSDAVAIGPGLGQGEGAAELLDKVIEGCKGPLVIDADALNLVARQPDRIAPARDRIVMTPHPGEAARLLDSDPKAVQADRLGAAGELVKRYGTVFVLKGAVTLVARPDGPTVLSPPGTRAMASGGMGDALTGLTVSLLGQGMERFEAALAAVWLHGRAGEIAAGAGEIAAGAGEIAAGAADAGLLASDLIEAIPRARAELRP